MSKSGRALLLVVFLLSCLGLVMTYSASAMYADKRMGDSGFFFARQLTAAVIGYIALFVCIYVHPFWIRKYSRVWILSSLFLLLTVFVPHLGRPAGGAHRWIYIFGFNFQPAEWAKFAVCIYMADYLTRKRSWIALGRWDVFTGPLTLLAAMGIIFMAQPDFGSAAMLAVLVLTLFYLAGVRTSQLLCTVWVGLPLAACLIVSRPYRWNRIVSFLNPDVDAQGSGYQIIQSFVAFGLGGFNGVGLGAGTQKLFYLPQSHTDFIFAILGEEAGLLGTAGVVLLFVLFLYFGMRIAFRSRDPYLRLVTVGLIFIIVMQAVVNMWVTTGMLPTKGLPLPFLSYGGSALLFNMIAVGLILAIDRNTVKSCAL